MTEYLYRVVQRVKPDFWPPHKDPALNVWAVVNNRSYNTLSVVKGLKTREENFYSDWANDGGLEFKLQRFPMTQQWEDVNE